MSSRTRTHCPGCGSAYPPRVRKCALCGLARDQMSDAEVAAQFAPPQPIAAPAPTKAQPTAFSTAPLAAPPVAPAQGVQMAPKAKAAWWAAGILAFVFLLFKLATIPTKPDATPPPAPVAYVPSAQEKAQAAKQAASEAKFWAEKAKKEQAEVAAYNERQQPLADSRAEQAAAMPEAQESSDVRYTSEQNQPSPTRRRHSIYDQPRHRTSSGKRSHYSPKWGR